MKRTISRIMLALLAVACVFTFNSCSKHKGYKLDKESGIYYKFHILNKDSAQVQTGDALYMQCRWALKDSILQDFTPIQVLVEESQYKNDVNNAFRMMHVGDSATFIFDADTFFYYIGGENPFDEKDLYLTFKLEELIPKAEVEAIMAEQEAQYNAYMEQQRAVEDSIMNEYIAKNKIKVAPTASGLYFIPKKAGKGAQAMAGQKVAVHYTGKFLDGTKFDSSIDRGEPIEFILGQGRVIPGWDEGIAMMKEGEKAVLLIPSKLAYGENGNQVIPPCTPLVFDVELVKVGE
jgi:FKBP-type peptidyl-prolyl cis-trans isomerase